MKTSLMTELRLGLASFLGAGLMLGLLATLLLFVSRSI